MIHFQQWLSEHALFGAMLLASVFGHWALARNHDDISIRDTYEHEYGQTTVAVTLIAASQEVEQAIEELVKDAKEPAETAPARTAPTVVDAPLSKTAKDVEQILVAEAPMPQSFEVPVPTPPQIQREEEAPELAESNEARPRVKKKTAAAKPEAELIEANSEVNFMSQQSSGIDVPPKYRSNPAPPYPPNLRASKVRASVVLKVLVGINGRAVRVNVDQSSGFAEMDQSSVDTVRERWEFDPALLGGRPVEHEVTFSVNFSVSERRKN